MFLLLCWQFLLQIVIVFGIIILQMLSIIVTVLHALCRLLTLYYRATVTKYFFVVAACVGFGTSCFYVRIGSISFSSRCLKEFNKPK